MKRFAQQFNTEAKKQRLTAEEKFLTREKLVTFMEYHPLPRLSESTSTLRINLSEPYVVIAFPWRRLRMGMSMLVLSAVIAVPAFAEQTLPGDILYPVKVRVNEEVRGSMARTPVDKAEWATTLLERRLSEARTLAKTGRLEAVENSVVAAVEKQKNVVKISIENLRTADIAEADMAEVSFASIMEVQTAALQSQLSANEFNNASTSAPVIALVNNLEEEMDRLLTTSEISQDVPIERFMAQVERQTTRAYERLASLRKIITLQETDDVTRRLKDVEVKVAKSLALIDESPDAAREQFRFILGDVQKLIAFMNDLDIRKSMSVDKVVPIVLTYEERLAILAPQIDRLVNDINKVEQKIASAKDDSVKEKITFHLPTLKTFVTESSVLNPENIDTIELQYRAALSLMENIKVLVRIPVAPIAVEVDDQVRGLSSSTIEATSTSTATVSSDV